jgi:hypothetical protein
MGQPCRYAAVKGQFDDNATFPERKVVTVVGTAV